jgi:hypothetical protein
MAPQGNEVNNYKRINMVRDEFQGNWNYIIGSRTG